MGVVGFAVLTVLRIDYESLVSVVNDNDTELKDIGLSLVIPARNEEKNLPKLCKSIQNQSMKPYEVIVVDDASEDGTAEIAEGYGYRVIEAQFPALDIKPKVNAMHRGFMHSSGDVVVFLDADVELKKDFIEKLTTVFSNKSVDCLTLQPFHRCRNLVDLLSMFFHLVSLIGSGLFSVLRFRVGLFGPCVAITRKAYLQSEGFNNKDVRNSVVEDVALEKVLTSQGYTIFRLMGSAIIEYRMYNNLKDFFLGWKKNISIGANSAPIWVIGLLVLYLGFLISAPISLILGAGSFTLPIFIVYSAALLLLLNIARYVGDYSLGVLIYPLLLAVFFIVFAASLLSKIFRRKVSWKGRSLKL